MPDLGELEKVPLREFWANEALHFTPWLASNIARLSKLINLELEVEAQEQAIGTFRADIVCKNKDSGSIVLVENQLEGTDHTHLGQILTYAAAVNAATVIWIAERFTDEHRNALYWLNHATRDGLKFYGVELALFRIGDAIAPQFTLIVEPTSSFNAQMTRARTPIQQQCFEYWSDLIAALRADQSHVYAPKGPRANAYQAFDSGLSPGILCSWLNLSKSYQGVFYSFRTVSGRENYYAPLLAMKAEIEKIIPLPLTWDGTRSYEVSAQIPFNLSRRDTWQEAISWAVNALRLFQTGLQPIVRELFQAVPSYTAESDAV